MCAIVLKHQDHYLERLVRRQSPSTLSITIFFVIDLFGRLSQYILVLKGAKRDWEGVVSIFSQKIWNRVVGPSFYQPLLIFCFKLCGWQATEMLGGSLLKECRPVSIMKYLCVLATSKSHSLQSSSTLCLGVLWL